MPTTYSTSLRLWEGQPGDPAVRNAWGTALNTNMNLIEAAILGSATIDVTDQSAVTLTVANGAADESRPMMQIFTGALLSDCTVTYPNVPKLFQAINNTTGGFNIILTCGVGTTVTVPPDQLPYNCICDGSTDITIYQEQPGPRYGDQKHSAIALEGGGWRLAYGQTRPRTDPLWQWLTATGQTAAWLWGTGDGSTTYTMPDLRGRTPFGLDNMGGTAANRITTAISGINGAAMASVGGSEALTAHTHPLTITDPGHAHTSPAHVHGVSDPGHNHGQSPHGHGVSDPSHAHGVSDPGHSHNVTTLGGQGRGAVLGGAGAPAESSTNYGTSGSGTGIGIFGAFTGIGIQGANANINAAVTGIGIAGTAVTIAANKTGITGSAASAGAGASQNMPGTAIMASLIYVGA